MSQARSVIVAAITVLSASASFAAPQKNTNATPTASSTGSIVEASFTINDTSGTLPKADKVIATGKAPPAYDVEPATVAHFSKSGSFPGGLTLAVAGSGLTVKAISAGVNGAGAIESHSSSKADSFSTTINSPFGAVLTATASNLMTTASFTKAKSGSSTAQYSIGFGKVTINAPDFGINNKTYDASKQGAPKLNKVFYKSADGTVKIVLNEQISGATGLTQSAIALHVKNFNYQGIATVSANVTIVTSIAK